MIRAVSNKKIYLNNSEYNYFLELEKEFGDRCLNGLFETNDAGKIISITPSVRESTPLVIIFFLLNVMMNQRLEGVDKLLNRVLVLEDKISEIEEKAHGTV